MLTDAKLRTLKPLDTIKKYGDSGGMYLEVRPNGSKYWRLKYRLNGKENVFSMGVYPQVTLAEARKKRVEVKALLAEGIDPNQSKKDTKQARAMPNTFEAVANLWMAGREHVSEKTKIRDKANLTNDTYPYIGKRPIEQITSPMVLDIALRVEQRGAGNMARRVIDSIGQVMRYGMSHGLCKHDPTTGLKKCLKPIKVQHMARVEKKELPDLLKRIDAYDGEPITRLGLTLVNLTFLRTKELRFMEWGDVSYSDKEIRLPAERMKMGVMHIVPLSDQAIEILKQVHELTGHRSHVFYNPSTGKPYSENWFTSALNRMGYKGRMTGHGFRGLASTILHEQGYMHDAIERQLAHGDTNSVSAAYNHAQHLPYRRKMMQEWANYLDEVRTNSPTLSFNKIG